MTTPATLPAGWQDWPLPAQEQLLAALRRAALAKLGHIRPLWSTPGKLAKALDPKTRQTPALDLIDAELVDLVSREDGRLILSMPPQEGKASGLLAASPCGC
ncbi:hypothetical protein AB0395_41300 [Streptosporangium sp. NPDC051023]|uniref:hypothetical protein n=1 Tax=Streptosporangium sp. NPDC051023 TaxID=3155410 RepID=UPI00344E4C6F